MQSRAEHSVILRKVRDGRDGESAFSVQVADLAFSCSDGSDGNVPGTVILLEPNSTQRKVAQVRGFYGTQEAAITELTILNTENCVATAARHETVTSLWNIAVAPRYKNYILDDGEVVDAEDYGPPDGSEKLLIPCSSGSVTFQARLTCGDVSGEVVKTLGWTVDTSVQFSKWHHDAHEFRSEIGNIKTGYSTIEQTKERIRLGVQGLEEDLQRRTGIDIEAGVITAQTNTFQIVNNSGEQTALVNAQGQLYVKDGIFSGDVYARNGEFRGTVYAQRGEFNGEIVSKWPNGKPRISLNRDGGWLTYYYPNGSVMKEEVVVYKENVVSAIYTQVYNPNGTLNTRYGWDSGSEELTTPYWVVVPVNIIPTARPLSIRDTDSFRVPFTSLIHYFCDVDYNGDSGFISSIHDRTQTTSMVVLNKFWNIGESGFNPNNITQDNKTQYWSNFYVISERRDLPQASRYYVADETVYYRELQVYFQGSAGYKTNVIYGVNGIAEVTKDIIGTLPMTPGDITTG